MAPIRPHVDAVQVGQQILEDPTVLDHPQRELLDRLEIEIEGLGPEADFRSAPIIEVGRHLAGLGVGPEREAEALENGACPPCDQINVAAGISLRTKVSFPIRQMPR